MKLSQKEKEMIERINNYCLHEKEIQRYYERLVELGTGEGSMTAKYGEEMTSGSDFKNSKVESSVIRKITLLEKTKEANNEMLIVDMSMSCLTGEEYKVICHMKQGIKMSIIASIMQLKRKKIERIRNSAVRKMVCFNLKF